MGLVVRGQPGAGRQCGLRRSQRGYWGSIFVTKSQGRGYDKRYMPSFVKVCIDVKINLCY